MYLLLIIIVFRINTVYGDEIYADLDPALFCPSNNTCSPPSSHILCTEHDPKLKHGPKCTNFQDWAFTAAQVQIFLDWLNGIKRKMASGTLKIKGGIAPKGYGMIRLQWDPELAALSRYRLQLCDELIDSHNRCFWSGRFPKQVKSSVSLPYDASGSADSQLTFYKKYFDDEIIKHIDLGRLNKVNLDMQSNRLTILALTQGPATHIGCSMGQFPYVNDSKRIHRRTYCTISHFTESNEPLYNMTPPVKGTGLSPECGCPLHYRESEGCLCEEWRPDTTSTYATYRTFKPLSGLPSDQIQWKRGIPDKSISLDNRVRKRDPEIFLPIINIEKGGPAYSNIWELLYNNLRNVVMPSGSKPEPPNTYTSQPNSMETLNIYGMGNNAYNGLSTQTVTPLYYKDSFIDDIMDKYTKPAELTMNPGYDKHAFIYDTTDRNIKPTKQAMAPVRYREVLFDDFMKAMNAKSNKKEGVIKSPAEIIESLEYKSINSLEKIVSDYNKFVSRRNAAPTDTSDAPPADTLDAPLAETSDAPPVSTSDAPPADTSDTRPADTSNAPPADTSDARPADTSDASPADTSDAPPADTSDAPPTDTSDAPPADTSDAPPADTSDAPPTDTSDAPPADTSDASPADTSDAPPADTSDAPPADTSDALRK